MDMDMAAPFFTFTTNLTTFLAHAIMFMGCDDPTSNEI
jgi:hypothetical protein